jgi:hypothetical protein
MAFFKVNQQPGPTGDLARSLTYQEFPHHFVIKPDINNPQSKVWHLRQRQSFAIGRMCMLDQPPVKDFTFELY